MKKVVLVMFVLSFAIMACFCGGSSSSSKSKPSSSTCTTVEYDPPYQVVFIDGEADVYGGVDTPSKSVKGTVIGGAAGIEAKCGSYYRLKGVEWWGWVRISDTYK